MPRGHYPVLASLSRSYPRVRGRLLTCYAPVRHFTQEPKLPFSFDLHVLSTPPAFVLSQDQTLRTYFGEKFKHLFEFLKTRVPMLRRHEFLLWLSKSITLSRAKKLYCTAIFLSMEQHKKKIPQDGNSGMGVR